MTPMTPMMPYDVGTAGMVVETFLLARRRMWNAEKLAKNHQEVSTS